MVDSLYLPGQPMRNAVRRVTTEEAEVAKQVVGIILVFAECDPYMTDGDCFFCRRHNDEEHHPDCAHLAAVRLRDSGVFAPEP